MASLQNLRFFLHTHRRQLRVFAGFLLLGGAYYLVTLLTPLRIPCIFQKLTGFACPGCGVSHFCMKLLRLDIPGAVRENLALAVLSPLWLAGLCIRALWNPKWQHRRAAALWHRPESPRHGISAAILSAVALLFSSANMIKQHRFFLG